MKPASAAKSYDGVTLRQAALVAGFAYLLNPVSYAEFSVYPKLVAANNAAQTVQNISAHPEQSMATAKRLTSSASSVTSLLPGRSMSCLPRSTERCPCLPRGASWCTPPALSAACFAC
jgi:hypothetical protein